MFAPSFRVSVVFYSLSGPFAILKREEYDSVALGLTALQKYAEPKGFKHIQLVEDSDSYRVTATTPNGRPGRNIGTIEPVEDW